MKRGNNFKKKLIGCVAIVTVLVVGALIPSIVKKVNAATPGYFNQYDADLQKKISLDEGSGYDYLQGMAIYRDWAFYAKLDNKDKPDKDNKVRMWAYNLKSGKKFVVYNGSDLKNTDFRLGHANDIFINGKYVYVATMVPEWPISRFDLNIDNGNIYLTNRVNISVPGISETKKVYGIEYAGSMNQFLVRGLTTIYAGNFEGDKFKYDKKYTISENVNIQGQNISITAGKKFAHQGIYYKDGYLYLPMTSLERTQQSLVVAYKLNSNTPNGSVLKASSDMVVRIDSNYYSKVFEIEGVGCYNGQMYIAVNGRISDKETHDFITAVKDFRF